MSHGMWFAPGARACYDAGSSQHQKSLLKPARVVVQQIFKNEMARKSKKAAPAPQPEPSKGLDEFVPDAEGFDEEVVNIDPDKLRPPTKSRDWRDVEKLQEERYLRRQVKDDLDLLDDLLDPRRKR